MEPISTDTDLFGTAPNTEADRFLSRISHAGMEQFLKAAISFGVIHYKAGLDHCRAQLTNASLLIRIHKTAGELLRPSLSPDLSSADLQAYTSIVAGKLPAFCFLYSLIEGIAQATRPFEARKDSRLGEPEWDEWVHSQFTLHNALLYYHLYIESIKNDVTEINRSLETGRTDEIIAELTDTRKLTEIASESAHKTIYERNRKQLDQLMVRLTRFALLFSIVQVYAGFGVWWMDRLLPEQKETVSLKSSSWDLWHALLAIGQWPVVALTVILVYKVWVKQPLHETANIMKGQRLRDMPRRLHRKPRQPRKMANGSKVQQPKDERSDENSDESNETHVFDYSFFHEKLPDGSTKMIDDLAEHMPNIERGGDMSRCASQSSSRETPLSGVERIKYTLESRNSPEEKGGYVFYLEVDRRMKSDKEYLRAVRLVIRKPAGTQCAAKECAWHIICECINKLFGDDQNKNKVKDTLKEHFWGVPDTTNQTADENPVNGELDPPAAELDDQESRVGAKPDSQLVVRADPGGPRPDDHTTVDETHQR